MSKSIQLIFITLFFITSSCITKKESSSIVSLETTYGKVKVRLYPETMKHRENFLLLVKKGFYDGVLFHRVIVDFMIQAGDPNSKNSLPNAQLGAGDVGYTIPAEFIYPQYYHKRGALSAARMGDQSNPLKASSGCQFYIVQGRILTDEELNGLEKSNQQKLEANLFKDIMATKQEQIKGYNMEHNQQKINTLRDSILLEVGKLMQKNTSYKFTEQQRKDYKTVGGTPHLDGNYSVFGEVIEGLDIVEKISKTKKGQNDRPIEDLKIIKAEIVK